MSFWNQAFYFEKHEEGYIYRPTVFSDGFRVTEAQKDTLFRALIRQQLRMVAEALVVIAALAALFMSGAIEIEPPIIGVVLSGSVVLAVLGVVSFVRRDRLIARILGRLKPDVPRLPYRQAMARRRPMVTKRYGIGVLRSVVVLLGLAGLAGDALLLYMFVIAFRARGIAEQPADIATVERFFSLTWNNPGFWLVVALFNAVTIAGALYMTREIRRLRDTPELEERSAPRP